MKERPILFNAPMVRSIIDGSKTQTRRIMKPQPSMERDCEPEGYSWVPMHKGRELSHHQCPYGQPGDQLWVRETWQPHPEAGVAYPEGTIPSDAVCYSAEFSESERRECGPWKPSIHMPRWASRIQLEITGIRVERLQDISEVDARAEGIYKPLGSQFWHTDPSSNILPGEKPQWAYRNLWESINGPGSWEANPWVWVIEFRRIKP